MGITANAKIEEGHRHLQLAVQMISDANLHTFNQEYDALVARYVQLVEANTPVQSVNPDFIVKTHKFASDAKAFLNKVNVAVDNMKREMLASMVAPTD